MSRRAPCAQHLAKLGAERVRDALPLECALAPAQKAIVTIIAPPNRPPCFCRIASSNGAATGPIRKAIEIGTKIRAKKSARISTQTRMKIRVKIRTKFACANTFRTWRRHRIALLMHIRRTLSPSRWKAIALRDRPARDRPPVIVSLLDSSVLR